MRKHRTAAQGIAWMVASQLLFAASWAAIKFLGKGLPVMEIIFFRAICSILLIAPFLLLRRQGFKGRNYTALFLRSLFGFVAMVLSFYAMTKIQIGNASTLFNTLPIFVTLLAPLTLGEEFSKGKLLLVISAFAGIGLILKPDTQMFNGVSTFALMSGFFGALAMLCVRRLTSSDSAFIITFYFTGFTALCSAPFALIGYKPPTSFEWGWLAFLGTALTIAQIMMTRAYKLGNASTIAPFSYTSVMGAYLLGLFLFGELPDLWSLAGAIVVIGSGIGIMLSAPTTEEREEMESAKVT